MDAKAHYVTMTAYNQWANRALFAAVAALGDAAYREDRGAFFGSIRGTLNHILVADRIWLGRLEGHAPQSLTLDAILHDGLAALQAARVAEDERLATVIAAMPEQRFDAPFPYHNTQGTACSLPLTAILTHIFNHQTHHRAQAHTLIAQLGGDAPVLDLVYFLLQQPAKA